MHDDGSLIDDTYSVRYEQCGTTVNIVTHSAGHDCETDELAFESICLDPGSPGASCEITCFCRRLLDDSPKVQPATIDSALQLRQSIYKASFRYWWASSKILPYQG